MARATFTVDTQLFRELGELLVGEDATALTELVKNSYDADSRVVSIAGRSLGKPENSLITIADDGVGMNGEQFNHGFLTVAGREKTTGDRRSKIYRRIYTGEKGVGRLAARKLAKRLEVESWPWSGKLDVQGRLISQPTGIRATIDWDKIDRCRTFDDIPKSGAVRVETIPANGFRLAGTTLTLRRLRKSWTKKDIEKFQRRALTFRPPQVFTGQIPETFVARPLLLKSLFSQPAASNSEEPFRIDMLGAFDIVEPPGVSDAAAAQWVLEILSEPKRGQVTYTMAPSQKFQRKYPKAQVERAVIKVKRAQNPIPFRGRIYNLLNRSWDGSIAGVRVYMNGFRVLPYGEAKNDWLGLDDDTTSRARDLLRNLKGLAGDIPRSADSEEETKMQRNSAYWGLSR
ncbi:ATP-binding protein [Bradyrhizobium sp. BR 10289]|uniref:ATP-binding protein n=1 Tax=Bradyrhizobium sp. BR 10289 TaxID=2749993 RepID=UPI001C64C480|nr:ATP-binding protein [Bradyrhizobium sp. BR 10289]MBW7971873.1 ATP-binding protein [Bradyrhizobium sp. BR 10289]